MITKITDKFIENSEQVKQKLREGQIAIAMLNW